MSVDISVIGIGAVPNDGTGDNLRDAFTKVNDSFGNLKNATDNLQATYANTSVGVFANILVTNRSLGNIDFYGTDTVNINGSPVVTAAVAFPGGTVPGATTFSDSTESTSTATGALITAGGAGIAKRLNVGGNVIVSSITDTSGATSGAISTTGGVGIAKSLYVGQGATIIGATSINNTLGVTGITSLTGGVISTNPTTGTLVVTGGIGASGNLNVGGSSTINGDTVVLGNLTVTGTTSTGASDFAVADSIIDLHSFANAAPWTFDDGTDIGFVFQHYKPGYLNSWAFLGWANDTGHLEYYDRGEELTPGTFTGTAYGTMKLGALLLVNTTPSTSSVTGAVTTAGGLGVAGSIYTGDSINAGTTLTATTATIPTINSTSGNITTLNATNFSSGNIRITGGYATGLANVYATLGQTTNFSTGNAVITGGSLTNLTTITGTDASVTTLVATNFSTGNAVITGGSLTNLTTITGTNASATTLVATNFSTGNAVITGGATVTGITNITGTTVQATNFSSGNAVISGGSISGMSSIASSGTISGSNFSGNTSGTNTGDVTTTGAGNVTISGQQVTLTATGGAGSAGSSTAIPVITTDAYGRVSSKTTAAVVAPAGTLTGSTLAAGVTASSLTSVGTLAGLTVSSHIVPSANASIDIGSIGSWFGTFYGVSTQAQYADLAENYTSDAPYPPGTVVVFGGTSEVTTTDQFADVTVAGVVSMNPAYLMNSQVSGIPIALRGRVPCKVTGPVHKGDLLVTSQIAGHACSIGRDNTFGTSVFAKSLENKETEGEGVIEVVVI